MGLCMNAYVIPIFFAAIIGSMSDKEGRWYEAFANCEMYLLMHICGAASKAESSVHQTLWKHLPQKGKT